MDTDRITDLEDQDVIYLKKIDANTGQSGNQAFHLADHFTGHAGELVLSYQSGSNQTKVQGDVNGDGAADFTIVLNGDHTDFTNFVL